MHDYNFDINPPQRIDFDSYERESKLRYTQLLNEHGGDESVFQEFFERNPSFVPGAAAEFDFAPSGHSPFNNALISQPNIRGLFDRIPDFMWLANDSIVFSPILIEIEAPNKKYFNKDGSPTADFTKAKNQLDEWTTILSKPENQLLFFDSFSISEEYRNYHFEPYYVLIYGRRKEYSTERTLTRKRRTLVDKSMNQVLMSFDRLHPKEGLDEVICCNVKNGIYRAISLSPRTILGIHEFHLCAFEDLVDAVENMDFTTMERKKFLKNKLPYCIDFLKKQSHSKHVETFTLQDLMKQTYE